MRSPCRSLGGLLPLPSCSLPWPLLRRRAGPAVGPRVNQWKGVRASQFSEQREQARQERLTSRKRRAWRVSQWIVGLAALAWGLTMITREMGPILQGWLEIREVEIEGIHHVTKPEVLARLVLKPAMGLHEVSTAFIAGRVRTP